MKLPFPDKSVVSSGRVCGGRTWGGWGGGGLKKRVVGEKRKEQKNVTVFTEKKVSKN